ncbi:uncharacterized protein G2W53_004181 [Senna tora]|uniref:Uncharacterized protein n=1 Tax=Senna tora TaxID=362788 RepID=A0A834XA57_9FABA|nr:uncharacterized protein G2W53_004181 [Senna tora]
MTCKRSLFTEQHSIESQERSLRHMFYYIPELNNAALPFFLQIDPVPNDDSVPETFSRIPNFLSHNMPDLVGVDEGVLWFRKTKPNGSVRFFLWNPVTNQSVKIFVPNVRYFVPVSVFMKKIKNFA